MPGCQYNCCRPCLYMLCVQNQFTRKFCDWETTSVEQCAAFILLSSLLRATITHEVSKSVTPSNLFLPWDYSSVEVTQTKQTKQ